MADACPRLGKAAFGDGLRRGRPVHSFRNRRSTGRAKSVGVCSWYPSVRLNPWASRPRLKKPFMPFASRKSGAILWTLASSFSPFYRLSIPLIDFKANALISPSGVHIFRLRPSAAPRPSSCFVS